MTMDTESMTTGQQHQHQPAGGHFPTRNTGSLPNGQICQCNLNDSDHIIEVSLCHLASSQGMKVVFNMGALVPGDYSITLTLKLADSDMDPSLVTGMNLVSNKATIASASHSPLTRLRTVPVDSENSDSQSQMDYDLPTKYNFWCEHFMDLSWPFPEKPDDSDVEIIGGLTRTTSERECFSKALHALSPASFNQWFDTCAQLAKIMNPPNQICANAEELPHSKSLGPTKFLQMLSESMPVHNFMEMDSQPWDSDPTSGFPASFPKTPTRQPLRLQLKLTQKNVDNHTSMTHNLKAMPVHNSGKRGRDEWEMAQSLTPTWSSSSMALAAEVRKHFCISDLLGEDDGLVIPSSQVEELGLD
ncbi:hypothetical protein EDD18DRAFT_1103785 [Armillaria luteobubalina]|uniref:Uncharacterized protein n=1 Tax=Armillaria luteobubalina TaxID=153913 RepID=A0AA39QB01_9AGAR|nr:hypothetical protein EDD18DRAFT_1103785 [Armillaria luteobubalina]